jgi:hypothetical protein
MTGTAAAHSGSVHERYEEARRHFAGNGMLLATLARLTAALRSRDIGYLVIGAVALNAHGYPRYTTNLDIVISTEGLESFRKELLGRGEWGIFGFDSISENTKTVRSYPDGVVINFELAGHYPGDGKPKPVVFPHPSEGRRIGEVNFPTLEKLIELKLASGMTAPDRLKDLADVQELIKIRALTSDFAEKLDPYVRNKYWELLDAVQRGIKSQEQS